MCKIVSKTLYHQKKLVSRIILDIEIVFNQKNKK